MRHCGKLSDVARNANRVGGWPWKPGRFREAPSRSADWPGPVGGAGAWPSAVIFLAISGRPSLAWRGPMPAGCARGWREA